MLTIAVCDDHALVRGALRTMLERQPDLEIVGEAADGATAVELVREADPDVVLMDLEMPSVDGVEATCRIRAAGLRTAILVVTTYDDDVSVAAALRAGADGFVLKTADPDQLARAVRGVAAGELVLDQALVRRVVERIAATAPVDARLASRRLQALSAREQEVLRAVAAGGSNADIGRTLGLAEATVKMHVSRVLAKLRLTSRAQAVAFAYEAGLVRVGDRSLPGA